MKQQRLMKVISMSTPNEVVRLAAQFGYSRVDEKYRRGALLRHPSGDELLVPLEPKLRDYSATVLGILQILRPKTLAIEDMVTMLVLPPCDVYKHRYSDSFSRFGAFPLHEFPGAATALYDMFRFTAAGVQTGRRSYTRIPSDADAFARGCQVGQTEFRSYVIKIFCPVDPKVEQSVQGAPDPLGRMVVKACLENIAFLGLEESVLMDEVLPATLNKNVLGAVSRLKPSLFSASGEAQAWLNPAFEEPSLSPEHRGVQFRDETYSNASILERRLQPAENDEPLITRGYIVDLHKDRPSLTRTLTHEVTMDIRDGQSWRKLRMSLLPTQYRDAVRWHDAESEVRILASVDRTRTPWRTVEISVFEALDKNQMQLFVESASPTAGE